MSNLINEVWQNFTYGARIIIPTSTLKLWNDKLAACIGFRSHCISSDL